MLLPHVASATPAIFLFLGMNRNAREARQRGKTETARSDREEVYTIF
jgi:hypothetical protein